MESTQGLSSELLAEVQRNGGEWLAELAEQGRLTGDHAPLRRLAWLHFLGAVEGSSTEQWQQALDANRQWYNGIVDDYRKESDVKALDPNLCNPLNRSSNNPMTKLQANDELLKEIWKDVERTFPEVEYLAGNEGRKVLQRILFHWCRSVNPAQAASESYRQGMNELVAVSLAAVKSGEYVEGSSDDSLGICLCGSQHTEADTFLLFSRLMKLGLSPLFMAGSGPGRGAGGGPLGARGSPIGELPRSRNRGGKEEGLPTSPILARCSFIFDTLVAKVDKELHGHFTKVEVEPQVFLLRWLRLLFCREYDLEDTLVLWDGIFADVLRPPASLLKYPSPKPGGGSGEKVWQEAAESAGHLPLIDYVAAALLRSMRGQLLAMDQTECLRMLLKGKPEVDIGTLLAAAKKLRENPNPTPAIVSSAPPLSSLGPGGAASSPIAAAFNPNNPLANPLAPGGGLGGAPHRQEPFGMGRSREEVPALVRAPVAGAATLGHPSPANPLANPLRSSYPDSEAASAAADLRAGAAELRKGQQILSAAAHGAQGLLSVASQAVAVAGQRISEHVDIGQMEQLRRRAEAAEKELETLKKKANDFIAGKKAQISELKGQIEERDARILQIDSCGAATAETTGQSQGQPAAAESLEQLKTQAAEIKELQDCLQERGARIQSLENQLAEGGVSKEQIEEEGGVSKEQIEERDARIKELEVSLAENSAAQQELEVSLAKSTAPVDTDARVKELEESLAKSVESASLVTERDARIKELEASLAEASAAQGHVAERDARVKELEESLAKSGESASLAAERDTRIKELEASLAEASAAQGHVAEQGARIKELEASLAEASSAQGQVAEQSARIKELEASLTEASAAQGHVAEQGARIKELEASLAVARAAQGQLAERDARIRELEELELEERAKSVESARLITERDARIKELEASAAQGQLAERDVRIKELEASLAEASAAQGQVAEQGARIKELEASLAEASESSAQVQEREARIKELEVSLAENAAQQQQLEVEAKSAAAVVAPPAASDEQAAAAGLAIASACEALGSGAEEPQ